MVSTFRLETLQYYSVSTEDARMRAFREGTPRPEWSVRTSAWLRRIADPEDVELYRGLYSRLRARAANGPDAVTLIQRVTAELRG